MAEVFFFIAGALAVAGAIGVVTIPNPFYSVLALVVHLLALAALFLLLRAELVAAAQVVVYAGAVMVLYVFVVSYIGGEDEPLRPGDGGSLKALGVLSGLSLFVVFSIAVLGSGLTAIDSEGAGYEPGFGTPAAIGELLLTRFLLAFEVASFLLLIAAVGAVVLARRRGGLSEEDASRISVAELVSPQGIGTMAEGVGGHSGLIRPAPAAEEPEAPVGVEKGGW